MDDTRNVTQDGQTDVDEHIGTASALQEDTQRRQDDGEDDLADVAAARNPVSHGQSTTFLSLFVSLMVLSIADAQHKTTREEGLGALTRR